MKLEDIKSSMYIRTLFGNIYKIQDEEFEIKQSAFTGDVLYKKNNGFETITKASHNIIELIQSKDLIVDTKNNIYVVDRVEGDYVFTTSKNEYGLIITLVDYQIKSIVTKEQFESMSYKVVE